MSERKSRDELAERYASQKHIHERVSSRIYYNAFTDYSEGYDSREPEIKELQEKLSVARDALTSISSKHKTRHETEEYWIKISHEQCSAVLATDTKIAREALAKMGEKV